MSPEYNFFPAWFYSGIYMASMSLLFIPPIMLVILNFQFLKGKFSWITKHHFHIIFFCFFVLFIIGTMSKKGPETIQRTFSKMTPEEIGGLVYPGMEQLRVDYITKPHIGKWLRIKRKIKNRVIRNKVIGVEFEEVNQILMTCAFNKADWISDFMKLKTGDEIKVIGQIVRVAINYIRLRSCEIDKQPLASDGLLPFTSSHHWGSSSVSLAYALPERVW